jgi:hypothetical protein
MSKLSSIGLASLLIAVGSVAHAAHSGVNPGTGVPDFNIRAACRALAQIPEARIAEDQADTTQHCLDEEREARGQLVKEWSQFTTAERKACVGVSRQGEVDPVYSELVTCLEMERDAQEPALATGKSNAHR